MRALIVHAHENPNSFCSALAYSALDVLKKEGHDVQISDLYSLSFNPVGSKADFKSSSNSEYYKYPMEQLHAARIDTFAEDLKSEMKKLDHLELLVFNFPLWWYSMPAILKGWVDRVLAFGVAYGGEYGMGPNGRFKGARAMATITTGSPKDILPSSHKILSNIHDGIFRLLGFEVLEPFIAYGVSRIDEAERKELISQYEITLKNL